MRVRVRCERIDHPLLYDSGGRTPERRRLTEHQVFEVRDHSVLNLMGTISVRLRVPVICLCLLVPRVALAQDYDLVIRNGRVIDPATNTDQMLDVGIREGRVVALEAGLESTAESIDATGLVVAPGFIDLHSHGALIERNHLYQVHDGVTTTFEAEAGLYPFAEGLSEFEGQPIIHYGATAGYLSARLLVLDGLKRPHILNSKPQPQGLRGVWNGFRYFALKKPLHATHDPASDEEIDRIHGYVREAVKEGAVGIGLLLGYMTDGASRHEVQRVFTLAAEQGVPVFVHMRRAPKPGDTSSLLEVLNAAEKTGAALHIHHINSSAGESIKAYLSTITEARERGVDVTLEAYPYTAGSTAIGASFFDNPTFDPSKAEDPATGKRYTKDTFKAQRDADPDYVIIIHGNTEERVRSAIAEPRVMIASDTMPIKAAGQRVHPRSAGTYARVLARHSREYGDLTLLEAIRKMTLLPAQRLELVAPAMARKGRISVGCDADIVVFDPETIQDKATFKEPHQFSVGIVHVLVSGTPAVRDGRTVPGVYKGTLIRRGR